MTDGKYGIIKKSACLVKTRIRGGLVRMRRYDTMKNKRLYIPLVLFILGVILRYLLGSYLKTPTVYWDELKYYGIGRSIYQGLGLLVRNNTTNFQKILYALVLAPTFAVENVEARLKLITLINSVLMNSSVFPLWLLCGKLGVSKKKAVCISALLILWPDLLATETLMSESLYWPLFLWFTVLHFGASNDRPLLIGLAEGALIYIGYLCKEVFAALIPAAAICLLLEAKLCPRGKSDNKREWLRFICSAALFAALYLLGKLTVFSGMGRGYNQSGIAELASVAGVLMLFYSILYHIVGMFLSVQLLPAALPILRFRQLKTEHKRFLLYLGCFIAVAIVGIAYGISIREDLGQVYPRVHLRYCAPAIFLLLLIFAECPARPDSVKRDSELAALMIFAIAIMAIFRSSGTTEFDQTTLQWVSGLNALLEDLFYEGDMIYWVLQVIEIALALGASIGLYMYFSGRKKDVFYPFCVFLLIPVICSSIIGHGVIKESYVLHTDCFESADRLDDEFAELDGNILYLTDTYSQFRQAKAWDVCFDQTDRMYYYVFSGYTMQNYFRGTSGNLGPESYDSDARVSDFTFGGYVDMGHYSTTDRIDYVVIPYEAGLEATDGSSLELIPSMSDGCYAVYRNLVPETLDLSHIQRVLRSDIELDRSDYL